MELQVFKDFLVTKKINPQEFEQGDPITFNSFRILFEQVHPKSFIAQKLFLINKIRRLYQLESAEQELPVVIKKKNKPLIRRKQ